MTEPTHGHKFVGIDPGLSGAAVVYSPSDNWITRQARFKTPDDLVEGIARALTMDVTCAVIEHVHSMRSYGRKSAFSFGSYYGMAIGLLKLSGIPYIECAPVRWMNFIRKKLEWSWDEEFDSREASKQILKKGEYNHFFKYKSDHNTGDAFCLAYWLAENSQLMPANSNKMGNLEKLPCFHDLEKMRAERLGQEVAVVK